MELLFEDFLLFEGKETYVSIFLEAAKVTEHFHQACGYFGNTIYTTTQDCLLAHGCADLDHWYGEKLVNKTVWYWKGNLLK